ncbi:MAG: peptidase U32 family protein [Chloroflexota bacterium]
MMNQIWKPELLAPAKNLNRLKIAILYGADAVYVGGQKYGLRTRADNFTEAELAKAATFAHQHEAKLYVTLNAFLHDADFDGLADYCHFLEDIGIDAVIVSDLGVVRHVQQHSKLSIHLSTQASCLNLYAAQAWQKLGVKRLIVGRELSTSEGGTIQAQAGIEVEMFTHGAMCMAYSGHCTISNFTAGRDSNRGGCVQSCRFPFQLTTAEPSNLISVDALQSGTAVTTTPFMSSKDLWGIYQIEAFFRDRICSLKIEGRMKSPLYVATTCRAYRRLIDADADDTITEALLDEVAAELDAVPHRDYFSGSLETPAGPDSVFQQFNGVNRSSHQYIGQVIDITSDYFVLRLIENVALNDRLEFLTHDYQTVTWQVSELYTITGHPISEMRQDSLVCIPRPPALSSVQKLNVVRAAHQPEPEFA